MSDVETVVVMGPGVIGRGVALVSAAHGAAVWLVGRDHGRLNATLEWMDGAAQFMAENELLDRAEWPDARDRIRLTTDLAKAAREADFVVEAVVEDMAVKQPIMAELGRECPDTAVITSATSGLSITEFGRLSGCPERVVGTHFWNPSHLMPLVEVVRGEETSEDSMDRTSAFVRQIGKTPVRVNKDAPGFVGNRLLHALWREALAIVERGIASAEDVDRVARDTFGIRMPAVGPCENMDLVGLDLILTIHDYLLADLEGPTGPCGLLRSLVSEGKLGFKTGRGLRAWTPEEQKAVLRARDEQIVRVLRNRKGAQG